MAADLSPLVDNIIDSPIGSPIESASGSTRVAILNIVLAE